MAGIYGFMRYSDGVWKEGNDADIAIKAALPSKEQFNEMFDNPELPAFPD